MNATARCYKCGTTRFGASAQDENGWRCWPSCERIIEAEKAMLPAKLERAAREVASELIRLTTAHAAEVRALAYQLIRGSVGLVERPKIICLCGSSRFIDHFAILSWNLEKEGYICLGLHLLPSSYTAQESHLAEYEGVADRMDELHLRKIDLADEIFVVNVGGYIGDSTRREIAYAESLGKPIRWAEEAPR